MLELFRFFRLGIVNVVGVTVPGILFLLFAGIGFVLPLALITLYFNQLLTHVAQSDVWASVGSAYGDNKTTLTALFVLVAYVIGYIIRLYSPDELDRKSAKKSMKLVARDNPGLAEKMAEGDADLKEKFEREQASKKLGLAKGLRLRLSKRLKGLRLRLTGESEKPEAGRYCDDVDADDIAASIDKHFPYRGEKANKFPYDNFRDYLLNRGFGPLAECVPCEDEAAADPGGALTMGGKWTKTSVNMMKLKVHLMSPVLASVVESNEAHIRLLSGAWQAINACRRIVLAGIALSLLGGFANVLHEAHSLPSVFADEPPSFLPCLLAGVVLYMGMRWARKRIETMFHHQRVRELTHIVGCYYFCLESAATRGDGRGEGREE